MQRKFFYIAIMALVAMAVSGCAQRTATEGQRVVAVSIEPLRPLVEAIACDSMRVVTVLRPGSDPESFDPSINDMRMAQQAEMFMTVDLLPFEKKLASRLKGVEAVNVATGIELIEGTHGSHGGAGHNHGDGDPHVWSSIPNLKTLADNILVELTINDPANADYYKANHARLTARIDSVGAAIAERLNGHRGEAFVVWHPSLSYFARDYGLEQIALGQDNKEMSGRQLRDKINHAREHGVAAIFIQADIDSRQAETVTKELDIEPTSINPMSGDWEQQFNIITDAITR